MIIGTIDEIVRHPVKSFRGERVSKTMVMDYGLYGDRSHVIMDDKRPGKYLTITQYQQMVQYQAKFTGRETLDNYPKVEIIAPDGSLFQWGDEAFINRLATETRRKISLKKFTPEYVPTGAIEEEHIQLVTDASIQHLQGLWGKEVDYQRFRPNLFISLFNKIPFVEETWFGKRLKIGADVEIKVIRHCERCMIITVNPDTGEIDPTLLKTVAKERKNQFGVYASILKTGEINMGDQVVLLD